MARAHIWRVTLQHLGNLDFLSSTHMRLFFFPFPRTVWRTKVRAPSGTLRIGVKVPCVVQKEVKEASSLPFYSPLQTKGQKCPLHSVQRHMIKGTYAGVAVTSCHPLAMFCFSSCSELIPSFRLISARCFSFAANT